MIPRCHDIADTSQCWVDTVTLWWWGAEVEQEKSFKNCNIRHIEEISGEMKPFMKMFHLKSNFLTCLLLDQYCYPHSICRHVIGKPKLSSGQHVFPSHCWRSVSLHFSTDSYPQSTSPNPRRTWRTPWLQSVTWLEAAVWCLQRNWSTVCGSQAVVSVELQTLSIKLVLGEM